MAGVGLAARLAVVAWAASRIPPAADGEYYDKVATRIAAGEGYTWLWPDGVVTYAAHYPVGYPAMVAAGYALFGAHPVVAMLLNAALGAAAGLGTWALVREGLGDRHGARGILGGRGAQRLQNRSTVSRTTGAEAWGGAALAAGLVVALHPALVPYTPAIMTEGPTAALLAIAGACAASRRRLATGLVLGLAVLVRPQSLVFAPVLGALIARAATGATSRDTTAPDATRDTTASDAPAAHAPAWRAMLAGAAVVTALALAVCAPWTVRNCVRMDKCALVSVNGGWNLAIGTQTEDGAWREIQVPPECREVFQEAAKDDCFGAAARREILAHPWRWLAHAPAKLHATFDYFGAAPWYLHTANSSAFSYDAKVRLGTVETVVSRLLLAAALVGMLRTAPKRGYGLGAAVALGVIACFTVQAWPAYVLLGALALARWRDGLLYAYSGAILLGTAATHAVFFGAGRYGLVVVPFVTALALAQPPLRAHAWLRRRRTGDRR